MEVSSKVSLINETHTEEKPFACETCNKKFAFKCELVRHNETHSIENSFSNEEGLKKYYSKRGLKQH